MNLKNQETIPRAIGPYSQMREAGGLIFVSGQLPVDPASGALVDESIEAGARQVLDNIKALLESAGSSLRDVVKATIYLTDINDFGAVNEVYASYFEAPYPARACVQAAALPKGARIEMEAIAWRG